MFLLSTCSTAKRTDTASGDITVTNTTDYVILAGMKSFRGVVETTCAVMEWSVYLDDVAKLCLEELKTRSAERTESVTRVYAV